MGCFYFDSRDFLEVMMNSLTPVDVFDTLHVTSGPILVKTIVTTYFFYFGLVKFGFGLALMIFLRPPWKSPAQVYDS